MKIAAVPFLLALGFAVAANAECERDVADARSLVPRIEDAKLRMRAHYYLLRTQRELDEGDEFECAEAVSALQQILAEAHVTSGSDTK